MLPEGGFHCIILTDVTLALVLAIFHEFAILWLWRYIALAY
jgi:hypothetical protein